ncbi:MAG: tRNA (N6-threonylcarbamoyladenosine(37)-N6)-methyltransferase TrmO [Ruminococcus sp.]|nr:tRNA (N6-threonylcarbamoyladenosine(37)-N6)-methyltransferase TrmO [Ruminococcus sp.]
MSDTAFEIKAIARIHTDLTSKFGIPRQSGLVEELEGIIVFEPEYRAAEALRGIEEWSHLWLIWQFSENIGEWSPTVRPPRLGGNERVGVFATRSPFRPNSMGLSCVRLLGTEHTRDRGTVLRVAGADLMDGTPIFDIKPYLPLADCKPEASGGFTDTRQKRRVEAEIPDELADILPAEKLAALRALLSEDPRPAYQDDPERVYGFPYAGYEVRFRVEDGKAKVVDITPDKEHL